MSAFPRLACAVALIGVAAWADEAPKPRGKDERLPEGVVHGKPSGGNGVDGTTLKLPTTLHQTPRSITVVDSERIVFLRGPAGLLYGAANLPGSWRRHAPTP